MSKNRKVTASAAGGQVSSARYYGNGNGNGNDNENENENENEITYGTLPIQRALHHDA